MTAYLIAHPPARRQFRARSVKPTGCIVVHTAESAPDVTGPDTGAESVAEFIRRRSDPGSYHDLADSDSTINLVPYDMAAYGDGSSPLANDREYHVSAATQAAKWAQLPADWKRATARNMGRAAGRYAVWYAGKYGTRIPAKRITRAESEAGKAGFITHAERDPSRRSDPGKDFPWASFFDGYREVTEAEWNPTPNFDQIVVSARRAKRAAKAGSVAYRRAVRLERIARRSSTRY